jgi:hypothetical protein
VPDAPHWTLVGSVGSAHKALVDPCGLVSVAGSSWSLDWWVGAEDRWHVPSREAAVRQRRLGAAPIVETAMRVPGGDAVSRVWAVRSDAADAFVVEVENASPSPFALALAVRPFTPAGPGRVRRIELHDHRMTIDGRFAVVTGRAPSRAIGVGRGSGDLEALVVDGAAAEPPMASVRDRRGRARGAAVFPVAHRATLRAIVLEGAAAPDPSAVAGAEAARQGWAAHLASGAHVVLPDPRLQEAVDAARASLLLYDDGHQLEPAPHTGRRRRDDGRTLRAARAAWGVGDPDPDPGPNPVVDRIEGGRARDVAHRVAEASATWTWSKDGEGDHGAATADFLLAVRRLLVADDGADLAVLPELPTDWSGAPVEVQGFPVAGGRLSYALRWHGTRPALLWEFDGARRRITAPGLDPSWSSDDPAGESLLQR